MDFWAGKQTLKYTIKIEYLAGCSSVKELFNWKSITLQLQDLTSYCPYFLPYNFYDVNLENLVMEQLTVP